MMMFRRVVSPRGFIPVTVDAVKMRRKRCGSKNDDV